MQNEKAFPRQGYAYVGTIAAGTGVTEVIMVPSFAGELAAAWMNNDAAVAAAGTNYTTITIKDLTSSTVLASWTSNTTGSGSGALVKDTPFAMALGATKSWAAGDTIAIVKTETGTGAGTTQATITFEFVEGKYDAG